MKILTVILTATATAIMGYAMAQYKDGVVRMYSLKGDKGTLSVEKKEDKSFYYTLKITNIKEKSEYISDEKPRYVIKLETTDHLLSHWPKEKSEQAPTYLNGKLYYTQQNQRKSQWITLGNPSFKADQKELTVEIEELLPSRGTNTNMSLESVPSEIQDVELILFAFHTSS